MSTLLDLRWLVVSVGLVACACSADPARLDGPTQVLVSGDGLVYVADGYHNARIAVFSREGDFLRAWGSKGFAHGQLQTPHGLAWSGDGELVVADRDNARLQVFDTRGELVALVQGEAVGRPWSVAVARDGVIFVADGGDQTPNRPRAAIVELSPDGRVVRRFGRHGSAPGELDEPHMIAVSESRNVFVAELGNRRVQKFAPTGCDPRDDACEYVVVPNWPRLPATPPLQALSVAAAGGLVFIGREGEGAALWVFDESDGKRVAELGEGLSLRPHGVSVDEDGALWIADDAADRVYRIDPDGGASLVIGSDP